MFPNREHTQPTWLRTGHRPGQAWEAPCGETPSSRCEPATIKADTPPSTAAQASASELARLELEDEDAVRSITGWAVMHVTDARRVGYFGVALAVMPRPEQLKDTRTLADLASKVAARLERLYVLACDATLRQKSLLDDVPEEDDEDIVPGSESDLDSELGAQRLIAALSRGSVTVRVLGAPPVDIDPLGRHRATSGQFWHVGTSTLRGIVDNQSWRRGRAELHGRLQSLDGDGAEATRNIQVGVAEDCFRALLPYFAERRYCEFTIDVYRAKGILGGTVIRYAMTSFRAIADADMPLFR